MKSYKSIVLCLLVLIIMTGIIIGVIIICTKAYNKTDSYSHHNSTTSQSSDLWEEKVLTNALVGMLFSHSWSSPDELNPDAFFEFYETLVVSGDTEKLLNSDGKAEAYIPEEVVETTVQKYFDISPEYMRKCIYYREERKAYEVGGIGCVRDVKFIKKETKGDIVKLYFEIYFKETKESVGELSIRFKDENNYKYLSCTIEEIS